MVASHMYTLVKIGQTLHFLCVQLIALKLELKINYKKVDN